MGALRVQRIDREHGRSSRFSGGINVPDPPQRLGDSGNVGHGGLLRKSPMDNIHVVCILPTALALVAYLQVSEV